MLSYFKIEELVSPEIYEILGDASWRLIPQKVLSSLNSLREAFGSPLLVNNWKTGGMYRYSGIRPLGCSEGAKMSVHKLVHPTKTCFDVKTPQLNRLVELVMKDYAKYGISRIENPDITKTWLHLEFSTEKVDRLVVFNP